MKADEKRISEAVYRPQIKIIVQVVADYFGLTENSVRESRRFKDIATARAWIHYLSRILYPRCQLAIVGALSGNGHYYDHSTVSHNFNKIDREINLKNREGRPVYPEMRNTEIWLKSRINNELRLRLQYIDLEDFATHIGNAYN